MAGVGRDLNCDGIPDLIPSRSYFTWNGGPIQVLLGNGDGTFRPGPLLVDSNAAQS